jgi:transposase
MNKRPGYLKEVRERAARLVSSGEHDHSSRWAAIQSVASKIGCTPETLRSRVKKMEVDAGVQPGITTNQSQRTKKLEREVREFKRTNEILRKAAAFFSQADVDRKPK